MSRGVWIAWALVLSIAPVDGQVEHSVPSPVPVDAASADAFTLTWEVPEGCPSEARLRERIAHYLGVEGIVEPLGGLEVRARVAAGDEGFELELLLQSARSHDEVAVSAPRCEVLTDIVALKVALALDPRSVVEELEIRELKADDSRDEASAEPDPTPPPKPEPREPVPKPQPPPLEALQFTPGVALLGGRAVLPTADLGVAASATLGRGPWRARAELDFLSSPPQALDDPRVDASARLQSFALGGAVEGCVAPRAGAVHLPLCAGVLALGVRARAVAIAESGAAWRPWVGASVGAGLSWTVSDSLAVSLQARLRLPVLRPRFDILGLGEVYRSDPVGGHLALTLHLGPHPFGSN